METLLQLSRALENVTSKIAKIAVWLIFALMLVIVSDVVLRHWFVIGSTKLQELEWHLHGAAFLLCLGWAYSNNAHVRIELFSEKLSLKKRAYIELLGIALFLVPYIMAVLVFGFDYAAFSWEYGESSASATGLPYRWIIKSTILVGFSLLGLAALSRLLQTFLFLFARPTIAAQTYWAKPNEGVGGLS